MVYRGGGAAEPVLLLMEHEPLMKVIDVYQLPIDRAAFVIDLVSMITDCKTMELYFFAL